MARTFTFQAELWLWRDGSWHFVTLPEDLSDEIEELYGSNAAGFGSLPVEVTIGATTWRTSVFPSKSAAAYVLPVKASVRNAEGFGAGDTVNVQLSVRV